MAKKKKDTDKSKNKPVKKKRGRGRPKKRGRPRKYYKPKKRKKKSSKAQQRKGFGSNASYNRVRSLLWSTFKNDFISYRDFISNKVDESGNKIKGSSIPSQVYDECKDVQCTDDDIIQIYLSIKGQDQEGDIPLIPEVFFNPNPYWTLITENIYDALDERLWLVSPMLLNEPPFFLGILGEDRCVDKDNKTVDLSRCDEEGNKFVQGKKYRFKPFVDYCNQMQTKSDIQLDSYSAPHWKFIGQGENEQQAYWNDINKRWEVQVVPCMEDGTIESYKFDPSDLSPELPDDFELPLPEEKTEEPEEVIPSIEQAKIEQIEKTGKLERLEKKKEGVLKEIETYIKLGERGDKRIEDAIKRLDKLNDEIDQID